MNGDKLIIRDLALRCIIGFNHNERRDRQDVLINVTMDVDIARACETDRVEDSVNYRTVKKSIISLVEGSSFHLIEKLAEEVAALCLSHDRVNCVTVTIDKPGALRFARSVAVEITRYGNGDG